MWKLIGFIAVWIAVGMFLVLFVEHKLMGMLLILLFMFLVFNLCNN